MKEPKKISLRELLDPVLPPILFRNHPKFREWTGYSPRTLANRDSEGMGPDQRVTVGRICGYPKESLLRWLEDRVVPEKKRNKQSDPTCLL
jgi:hypothetical protein